MKKVEFLQRSLDDKKQGDYINLKGSRNQILNANIFDKDDYDCFYNNEDDIVVTYYGLSNDGAEYSFKLGHPNQDDQQKALNRFVKEWIEQNWN